MAGEYLHKYIPIIVANTDLSKTQCLWLKHERSPNVLMASEVK